MIVITDTNIFYSALAAPLLDFTEWGTNIF